MQRFGHAVAVLAVICVLTVVCFAVTFSGVRAGAEAKVGKVIVTGGIVPCSGLPPSMVHGLPRYAAGTVAVLQGKLRWEKWSNGVRHLIFPRHVVAKATVKVNQKYRFLLGPGPYVLTARLPRSNVRPFVQIDVPEGKDMHVNIPNMCK